MRIFICFLLLIPLLFSDLTAQNSRKDILHQELDQYFSLIADKKFEKTLDYIYPKVFEYIPRDSFKQILSSMNGMKGFVILESNHEIDKMSKAYSIDKLNIILVEYSFDIDFNVKNEMIDMNNLFHAFKKKFGVENVKMNRGERRITVSTSNLLYAIDSGEYPGYKFLRSGRISNYILPEEALEIELN